jgi:hypothetical protein
MSAINKDMLTKESLLRLLTSDSGPGETSSAAGAASSASGSNAKSALRASIKHMQLSTRKMQSKAMKSKKGTKSLGPVERMIGAREVYTDQGNSNSEVYHYVQHYATGTISSGSTAIFGSYSQSLNSLDQVSTFTGLYDQYKFDLIEATFYPMVTYGIATSGSSPLYPLIWVYVDYDDTSTPSLALAHQRQDAIVNDCFTKFTVRYKPQIATAVSTGSFTGSGNVNLWVDCSSPTVLWYGLKYAVEAGSATAVVGWNVSFKAFFSFRNVL